MLYTYSISQDTATGRADPKALDYELRRLDPPLASAPLVKVSQDHDELELEFEGELSAGDQAALREAIRLHQGIPVPVSVVIQTAHVSTLFAVSSPVWSDVGGVVTRPETFGPLPQLTARITCAAQAPAGGIDLRMVERDEDQTERELGSWTISDSAGSWRFLELDATGATPGAHEYVLEAKLSVGGQSGEIRSAAFSLIRTEGA